MIETAHRSTAPSRRQDLRVLKWLRHLGHCEVLNEPTSGKPLLNLPFKDAQLLDDRVKRKGISIEHLG